MNEIKNENHDGNYDDDDYETFVSKQLIKCSCNLFTLKRVSIGDFLSNILFVKTLTNGQELYPLFGFQTGRKLPINSSKEFLYNA